MRPEPGIHFKVRQMGQISKIFHWSEYFAQELDAGGPESIFTLILAALPVNITARSFWPMGDQMGHIFKFFPWREYFAPELDANGLKSFPPGFFTHFGRPTAKNFDRSFWLACDKNLGSI